MKEERKERGKEGGSERDEGRDKRGARARGRERDLKWQLARKNSPLTIRGFLFLPASGTGKYIATISGNLDFPKQSSWRHNYPYSQVLLMITYVLCFEINSEVPNWICSLYFFSLQEHIWTTRFTEKGGQILLIQQCACKFTYKFLSILDSHLIDFS